MSWRDWLKPKLTSSVIDGCYIKGRSDELPMFRACHTGRGDMIVNLNGYAVIPIEEYERLTNEETSQDG